MRVGERAPWQEGRRESDIRRAAERANRLLLRGLALEIQDAALPRFTTLKDRVEYLEGIVEIEEVGESIFGVNCSCSNHGVVRNTSERKLP